MMGWQTNPTYFSPPRPSLRSPERIPQWDTTLSEEDEIVWRGGDSIDASPLRSPNLRQSYDLAIGEAQAKAAESKQTETQTQTPTRTGTRTGPDMSTTELTPTPTRTQTQTHTQSRTSPMRTLRPTQDVRPGLPLPPSPSALPLPVPMSALELEREEKKRLQAEAEQVTEILRFSRFSMKDSIYQNMFIRFLTRFPI